MLEDPREKIGAIIKTMEDETRKFGLYLENAAIGTSDGSGPEVLDDPDKIKKILLSDEEDVFVMATFAIGDVAWSKRVQDPEQDKIDDQARTILPDPVEALKEKMRQAQAEGKSILDLDLGGDDDAGED